MEKPPYDLEGLKKAVVKCEQNIVSIKAGIEIEEQYKTELLFYIKQWEKYYKEHPEQKVSD